MEPAFRQLFIILTSAFLFLLFGIYLTSSKIENKEKSDPEIQLIDPPDVIIKVNNSFEQVGFHLHLKSQFELVKNNKFLNLTQSQIKMQWELPADVLVDIYKLNRSNRKAKFSTNLPVDIEKAVHLSHPFILQANLDMDSNLELDIEFNARYSKASVENFNAFLLPRPIYGLLWDQKSKQNSCSETALISKKNSKTYKVEELASLFPLEITVPVMPERKEYLVVTVGIHSLLAFLLSLLLLVK